MNTSNDVPLNLHLHWDLEYEALIQHNGYVDLPISMTQWNAKNVSFDEDTKQRMIWLKLTKVWNSLANNLSKKLNLWIKTNHTLPNPQFVVNLAKASTAKYPKLLETSPFMITKVINKINSSICIYNQKQPLCTASLNHHHFTRRHDVLNFLKIQSTYKETKSTAKRQQNKRKTSSPDKTMNQFDILHNLTQYKNRANNIGNNVTINISTSGDISNLLNGNVNSFSYEDENETLQSEIVSGKHHETFKN